MVDISGVAFAGQLPSPTGRDWASWRGPFGNHTTDERDWNPRALEGGATICWQVNIGRGHGAVSVRGNRVYAFGNQKNEISGRLTDCDVVTCLDAATGREIWRYAYASHPGNSPGPRATPFVDANCVYTHSRHGRVHCLEMDTGRVIWSTDLKDFGYKEPRFGFCSSPVIHDNILLLCVGGSGIALDKRTGRKIWSGDTRMADCQSSPILFEREGQTVSVLMNREAMNIVDVQTGQVRLSFPWGFSRNDASVIQNMLLLSNTQDGAVLLDISSDPPKPVWRREHIFGSLQGFVIFKRWAFGFGRREKRSYLQFGGPFQCVNIDQGKVEWEHDLGFWGSMILAYDKLIIITGDGRLIVAEPSSQGFQEISSAPIYHINSRDLQGPHNCCWTMPVLSHGRVYVRAIDGNLTCVDMR